MSLLAAATLVVSVWATAVGPDGGLEIESGTPDDLCPEKAATEAAVRGRLGGVLKGDGEATWKARYSTWYAPEALARLLRIEILDPSGRVQQTKDIQTAGATCESLAYAIAVVVESYFRRPNPAAVSPHASVRLPFMTVGAGAASQSHGPGVGVSVDAGLRIAPRATLMIGAVLPRRRASEAVGAGSAELRGLPIRVGVGMELLSRKPWGVELGPEALALVETAETYDLAETQQSTRLVFGLGAASTVRLVLGAWSVGLMGSLVASLPLDGSKLVVALPSGEVEVLAPPPVVARLMLGVSYGFFFPAGP